MEKLKKKHSPIKDKLALTQPTRLKFNLIWKDFMKPNNPEKTPDEVITEILTDLKTSIGNQDKTLDPETELLQQIAKHREKVAEDNEKKTTHARVNKLNVLDGMKKHVENEFTLTDLQLAVDANPLYRDGFFNSKTEALLHKVVAVKDGEELEKIFKYKK